MQQIWMAEAAMPAARRLLEAAQAAAPDQQFVWDTPLLRPAADAKQVRTVMLKQLIVCRGDCEAGAC